MEPPAVSIQDHASEPEQNEGFGSLVCAVLGNLRESANARKGYEQDEQVCDAMIEWAKIQRFELCKSVREMREEHSQWAEEDKERLARLEETRAAFEVATDQLSEVEIQDGLRNPKRFSIEQQAAAYEYRKAFTVHNETVLRVRSELDQLRSIQETIEQYQERKNLAFALNQKILDASWEKIAGLDDLIVRDVLDLVLEWNRNKEHGRGSSL